MTTRAELRGEGDAVEQHHGERDGGGTGIAARRGRAHPWRLWALCALLVVLSGWFRPYAELSAPNERSRLYLAVAMVDHHSLSVDESIRRFGPILDIATHQGHRYSDKAPGLSFLMAPAYAALRWIAPAAGWNAAQLLGILRPLIMVPLTFLGVLLTAALCRRRGLGISQTNLALLAWMLGSGALHYATVLYGHHVLAVVMVAALLCSPMGTSVTSPGGLRQGVLGRDASRALSFGALLGLMPLIEYQGALAAIAFGVAGLARRQPSWRHTVMTLGTASIGPLLLGLYHWQAFGGVFELPYHHLLDPRLRAVHGIGLAGVTWPTLRGLWGPWWSLHRGLWTTSPWLCLGLLGAHRAWRRGDRAFTVAVVGAWLGYGGFVSSSNMWEAGWSFGPRLLVPMLGVTVPFVAEGLDGVSARRGLRVLAASSIVYAAALYGLAQATFPEPTPDLLHPLRDLFLPLFANGLWSPSWAMSWGIVPELLTGLLWSAAALTLVALLVGRWLAESRAWGAVVRELLLSLGFGLGALGLMAAVPSATPSSVQQGNLAWVESLSRRARGNP